MSDDDYSSLLVLLFALFAVDVVVSLTPTVAIIIIIIALMPNSDNDSTRLDYSVLCA